MHKPAVQKTAQRFTSLVFAAVLALGAAACVTESPGSQTPVEPAPTSQNQAPLVIEDAWVKSAESGMSSAFGVLINNTAEDITVVRAITEASPMVELHETVENEQGQMVMREVEGGFVVGANSEYLLEPGGNHLMLMRLSAPLLAGNIVSFTLELENGEELIFEAPVKDYSGANEQYEHDHDHHDDHEGHDH